MKGGKKQIWSNDATDKVTTKTTGDNEDSDADDGDKSDSGMEGIKDKNTIDHYVNYIFLFHRGDILFSSCLSQGAVIVLIVW